MPFGALRRVNNRHQRPKSQVEIKTMPFGALRLGKVEHPPGTTILWKLKQCPSGHYDVEYVQFVQITRDIVEIKTMPFGALRHPYRLKNTYICVHVEIKTMPFGALRLSATCRGETHQRVEIKTMPFGALRPLCHLV